MSASQLESVREIDVNAARRALLRYQPPSNWVSVSRDPTQRMTVGYGLDLGRPESSAMLQHVGLDPAAVRAGRVAVSDAEMDELFDLTLIAAIRVAERRVPGFADLPQEGQWALLEVIVWLGDEGSEALFDELERMSLPLSREPCEPAQWFDVAQRGRSTRGARPRQRVSASDCRLRFESFGVVADLVSDDPELLEAAIEMLPPGWISTDGCSTAVFGIWMNGTISMNGAQVDGPHDRPASLLKLGAIVRHRLATVSPPFVFVHAGVVEVDGCGVVIPGRSYTGKSTLVAELVGLGARYMSDEYAVLDASGLMHPFAKPMSLRAGWHDPLGRLVPAPDALVADGPVRAGLIVLTSFEPGAQWRPTVRSSAEGALALLQNAVSARLRPGPAMHATSEVARSAVVLSSQRGEASETAQAILDAALLHAGGSVRFPP